MRTIIIVLLISVSILCVATIASAETAPTPIPPIYRYLLAHIVAGEAIDSHAARLVVACNLRYDVERRGYNLAQLTSRWYGWRTPKKEDWAAVDVALMDGCEGIPDCRFVGNLRDLIVWNTRGWVSQDLPVLLWLDARGNMLACVQRPSQN